MTRHICRAAAIAVAVTIVGSAQALLLPSADTYTSEYSPDGVRGDRHYVKIEEPAFTRYGYIQFDVPNLTYTWAQLRLHCELSEVAGLSSATMAAIERCDMTPWNEVDPGGLTWNTSPKPEPGPLFTAATTSVAPDQWSIVGLPPDWFNGGGLITMRLEMMTQDGVARFESRETGCSGPKLDLEPSNVPEPASCALLAMAVGGIGVALRRRRTQ